MKIELFYTPGCTRCDTARAGLKAAVADACGDVAPQWSELNVLEHLDYAVKLGVLTLPAIAIDGELTFTALPTPEELAQELARRAERERA